MQYVIHPQHACSIFPAAEKLLDICKFHCLQRGAEPPFFPLRTLRFQTAFFTQENFKNPQNVA